jgi:hypothetical protein
MELKENYELLFYKSFSYNYKIFFLVQFINLKVLATLELNKRILKNILSFIL